MHETNGTTDLSMRYKEVALLELLDRVLDKGVVVAGDLNLSDRAGGYRILTGVYRDAMRAGVWATDTYRLHVWRALLLRIDHVFVTESLATRAVAAERDRDARKPSTYPGIPSDHAPLVVDFDDQSRQASGE